MFQSLLNDIMAGDERALSRGISLISNNVPGHEYLLENLPVSNTPVIGITGPPGAGKSTLTDKLISHLVVGNYNIAVVCVDPSSPFTHGAVLGDRIRMSEWYDHPSVFIRSLATRGSLGGLPPHVEKIIRLLRAAHFNYIFIETVGVGQNEIDVSSLADVTVVVLVPESGDDIQFMKAGLMEIADIFVVNKSDRPGADQFANEIRAMIRHSPNEESRRKQVIKTIANTRMGVGELVEAIKSFF